MYMNASWLNSEALQKAGTYIASYKYIPLGKMCDAGIRYLVQYTHT